MIDAEGLHTVLEKVPAVHDAPSPSDMGRRLCKKCTQIKQYDVRYLYISVYISMDIYYISMNRYCISVDNYYIFDIRGYIIIYISMDFY